MKTFNRQTTGIEVVQALQQQVEGKTILITGASANGLGAETAISLAHCNPAHLLLHGRTAAKISPVIAAIEKLNPRIKATFIEADLSSLASVRSAAASINAQIPHLDILINNAGIMAVKSYTQTADGIESQLGVNHVAHFLLTNLLLPNSLAGSNARIVNVSSDGYLLSPFRFSNPNFSSGATYDQWTAYGQSKTANILFTKALARRLALKGISSFCLHPGVISETSLGSHVPREDFGELAEVARRNTGKEFVMDMPVKSRQEGCATTLVAALDPRLTGEDSGAFLTDCQVKVLEARCESVEDAERLWEISEGLVGEKFDV